MCEPSLESRPAGDWPETSTVRGREAVWDFLVRADDAWEPGAYQLAEILDAGEGRVLAHQLREMRGAGSGAAVSYDYWVLVALRASTVARVEWFATREEALRAAGLER